MTVEETSFKYDLRSGNVAIIQLNRCRAKPYIHVGIRTTKGLTKLRSKGA